jgi:hypothetical protein
MRRDLLCASAAASLLIAPQAAKAEDWYLVGVGAFVLPIVLGTLLIQLVTTLIVASSRWSRRGSRSALIYFACSTATGLIALLLVRLAIELATHLSRSVVLDIALPSAIPALAWIVFLFSARRIDFRLRT